MLNDGTFLYWNKGLFPGITSWWASPVSVQGEVVLAGRCCGAVTLFPAAHSPSLSSPLHPCAPPPPPPFLPLSLLLAVAEVSRRCCSLGSLLRSDGLSSSVTLARPANGEDSDPEKSHEKPPEPEKVSHGLTSGL